ncbi:hypothetical protein L1987_56684 [Smallanthus sonchifolius]|uniref:Uncharacterized protein n=1 Tax=Smallanthus sonchifolius TaxID=185202 RepID=A0ACB9EDW2_9ASTR|nr:hypothetical protein L1987_56684 [Smallanthus sonchifolius]
MIQSMKKLCSKGKNDHENELEMVLEVSLPEETFIKTDTNAATKRWQHMFNLVRPQKDRAARWLTTLSSINDGSKDKQFMYFLKIAASSFIPFQVQSDHALSLPVRDGSIEASTAKYIVQQYIAATGGFAAMNTVNSMYVVGEVNMVQGQIQEDDQDKTRGRDGSESGAYMLWQKNPNLWFMELVVSGCRVSAGSDGTVTWTQSSLNPSQSSRGPPRPLRRFFQGLDPRSTVNLFLNAICIGEKIVMNEDCFILKLDTSQDILRAQSKANMETTQHTIQGYFSQRTGLLIQFEDTKLVKVKSTRKSCDRFVYYETSIESSLENYKYIDGVNIAHYGKTVTSIYRHEQGENTRWKIEETCTVKEVEFNICSLATDAFLPPPDVKNEEQVV